MTPADLLIEIGSEELPPRSLRELGEAFAAGILTGLAAAGLPTEQSRWFATPRRLAVLVPAVPAAQPPQQVEKRGPPVAVAFDAAGAPTRAAQAFADGLGVPVTALEQLTTPKGSWLHYRAEQPGRPTAELIPAIIDAALAALPIARRMRWGDGTAEFVRPVHWVVALHGAEVIPARVLGIDAGRRTEGHRFLGRGPHTLATASDYATVLREQGSVLADFAARRARVRELVATAGRELGGTAMLDDALLDEVTALVEWPAPVTGRIPVEFLRLPEDVLVATLQGHQRYFTVRDADGRLLPAFITVANVASRDPAMVAAGNERVVRPRLSDAGFFFDQDRATPLAARIDALGNVVFQQGLGSLKDKSARVASLGAALAAALGVDAALVDRAARLAKTDLLTQMVGEFPELQGVMGGHYARADGEPAAVAAAIAEHYLPRQAGDVIPPSAAGRVLALADRLDTLAGAFALGKRPSGNKDPFALRRGALGLLRIAIEGALELELPRFIEAALALQPVRIAEPAAVASDLYDFVMERLRAWYLDGLAPGLPAGSITAEMFDAVRLRRPASPRDFHARLLGVQRFVGLPESASLASANKRIANILKNAPPGSAAVDPALFEAPAEAALHAAVDGLAASHAARLARRDYPGVLQELAALRAPVDAFFDGVLVMAEDPARRSNRLALLARLRQMFLDVADLSCLPAP